MSNYEVKIVPLTKYKYRLRENTLEKWDEELPALSRPGAMYVHSRG